MEESKARKILDKNFIGTEELVKIQNNFSVLIPKSVPEIPFDESTLESKKLTHVLLLCPIYFADGITITIKSIKQKISEFNGIPCFYNQDWYLNEQFINKPLVVKWLFVSKSILDESRAMPADKVVSTYKLNSAVEITFAFFANYFVNDGEKLWNNDYVWCSDIDDKGDQIYVGRYTDASGLNADGFEIHRHLRIKKNYGVV